MGYYTYYELEIKDSATGQPASDADDIIEALRQDEYAAHALSDDGGSNNSCKWYDHEADLRAFSKKYPDKLFVLSGEGEESGDLWRKYFVNGQCQTAEAVITFAEFDPGKLG